MTVTTGFVQRFWWLTGGVGCVWIGDAPASAEVLTIAIGTTDGASTIAFKRSMAETLVEALVTGRQVAVGHPDDAAGITDVSYPAQDVAGTPLQLEGIEVTQAVQDPSQSVPLIAEKRTVVRVYLSYYADPGITVRGEISVPKSPKDPPTVIASSSTVALSSVDAGNLAVTRNDAARSLNFVLPTIMASEGPLAITVTGISNTVTGGVVPLGNERRPTVWFHRSAPLRVRLFGVRYAQGVPPVVHVPTDRDFAMLLSWLGRAYPAGQVHSSRVLITAAASAPFNCGDVNTQIAALRGLDLDTGEDQRTHYYGVVSDRGFFMRGCAGVPVNVPNPGAIGSGPTGPGTFGWDFDGSFGDWYSAHEIGHTFGRRHPGFCGETSDDADYPHPAGQLGSTNTDFMGFDVGDTALGIAMAALPGTQWRDVMTYCDFQWLSAYTYQGIRQRLLDEDNLGSAPAGAGRSAPASGGAGRPDNRFPPSSARPAAEPTGGGLVSVVASVNLTRNEGTIRYVNAVPHTAPAPTVDSGPAALRLKGANGDTLGEYTVSVKLYSERDPGDDEQGMIDAIIPADPGTSVIELLIADRVVDSFRAAAELPAIRSLRVNAGPGPDVDVVAETDLQSAAGLTYLFQVSSDGGHSWHTIAVGLAQPSFSIDRAQFPPDAEVTVRIGATNGLTRTILTTETLSPRR